MRAAAFLLLLMAAPAVFATRIDVCPDVKECLNTLGNAFDTLCPGVEPPTCSCSGEWEPVSLTRIGIVNMDSTSVQTFHIPSSVPKTAKEVLVYVYAYLGYSEDLLGQMTIYTTIGSKQFKKYLPIKTYNQEAWSSVSENMFFPMPSNRQIFVQLSRTFPGNANALVHVTGYR